jgi:hypothetical protein
LSPRSSDRSNQKAKQHASARQCHLASTYHAEFAESSEKASRFVPEVSRLAGLREPTPEGYESLAGLLSSEGSIGFFLDTPYQDRRGWNLIAGAPVLQMVCEDGASLAKLSSASDAQLVELNAEHSPAMTELTALTKPGPFIEPLRLKGRRFSGYA